MDRAGDRRAKIAKTTCAFRLAQTSFLAPFTFLPNRFYQSLRYRHSVVVFRCHQYAPVFSMVGVTLSASCRLRRTSHPSGSRQWVFRLRKIVHAPGSIEPQKIIGAKRSSNCHYDNRFRGSLPKQARLSWFEAWAHQLCSVYHYPI